eukprot:gene11313-7845_t
MFPRSAVFSQTSLPPQKEKQEKKKKAFTTFSFDFCLFYGVVWCSSGWGILLRLPEIARHGTLEQAAEAAEREAEREKDFPKETPSKYQSQHSARSSARSSAPDAFSLEQSAKWVLVCVLETDHNKNK